MTGPVIPRLAGRARAASGFTLLELMVVMVLIGIIFSFAVLSMRGDNVADLMAQEARRLETLLVLANDEAVVRGEELGVRFDEDGYEFLVLGQDGWQLSDSGPLKAYVMPADIHMRLALEGDLPDKGDAQADEDAEPPPQVLILSSGEMTPFTVTFDSHLSDYRYRLSATVMGELSQEREGPL